MPWRADGGPGDPGLVTCGRARDWIDPYLDDDLRRPEEEALDAHLADCPDCRTELAMARRLREAMREGLPLLSCPPEVTAEVLRVARGEVRQAPAPGLRERLARWLGEGALRPVLVAAAVLLLVVAAPLLYRSVVPSGPGAPPDATPVAVETPQAPYSPEEVAEAEAQARLVLAYVASVGRDAGRAVQEEVLDPGIGRPTRRIFDGLQAAGLAPETGGRNRP